MSTQGKLLWFLQCVSVRNLFFKQKYTNSSIINTNEISNKLTKLLHEITPKKPSSSKHCSNNATAKHQNITNCVNKVMCKKTNDYLNKKEKNFEKKLNIYGLIFESGLKIWVKHPKKQNSGLSVGLFWMWVSSNYK